MKLITTTKEQVANSFDNSREALEELDKLRPKFPDTPIGIYRGEDAQGAECWYLIELVPGQVNFIKYVQ